jgi:hypothetical protein
MRQRDRSHWEDINMQAGPRENQVYGRLLTQPPAAIDVRLVDSLRYSEASAGSRLVCCKAHDQRFRLHVLE